MGVHAILLADRATTVHVQMDGMEQFVIVSLFHYSANTRECKEFEPIYPAFKSP